MRIDELVRLLNCPCGCGAQLKMQEVCLRCSTSGRTVPVVDGRMIDFLPPPIKIASASDDRAQGLFGRINEFYNLRFEQKIAGSIFAAGGLASFFMRKKIKGWLDRVSPGTILDVGSGDQKYRRDMPAHLDYVPLDYVPAASYSPWRKSFPQINADATALPCKDASFEGVMNIFVLEHVKSPDKLIRESVRVLKPGGHLILIGPGDILMSHGEPHHYFNMTRFAYATLLSDLDVDIVEDAYPSKFWMSVASLIYQKIVRNDFYNRHPVFKAAQILILGVSLLVSPVINLAALLLDCMTPFDKRGYASYAILVQKRSQCD